MKKDAAFVESVFAAKAKREGQPEEVSVDNVPVEQEAPIMEMELSRRPDDMEEIIRAAEEAAYMGTEKQEDA